MKKSKIISLLLAGILSVSASVTVFATEDEIADMQAWKQEAEAGLEAAWANIGSLESKKQELEYYLADLDAQYEELANSISELSIEAAKKEEELKKIHKNLKKAKKASAKQYESMKQRIAYMYERGNTSTLQLLLSSGSVAEFINRAENISQISKYDRDKLAEYKELQAKIREQETAMKEESEAVNALMAERAAKKQEVQTMAANTSDEIAYYIAQISASEEEAAALRSEIANADMSIAALVAQAEAEAARAEEEAAREAQESASEDGYEEDYVESEDSYEESYEEEENYEEAGDSSYEEESTQGSGSGSAGNSGEGTYLGNFTLTAYCNCAQCCGSAGKATASGVMPSAGRTVAMAGVPFGTQLLINGNVYTVEDLGTPYGHVDIFMGSHADALSFGLQSAEVYRLN